MRTVLNETLWDMLGRALTNPHPVYPRGDKLHGRWTAFKILLLLDGETF